MVRIMRQFLLAIPAAIAAILFALLPSLHALIRMDERVSAVNGGAVYYNIQHEDNPFDTEITIIFS